jgi:hypothetical protein
VTNFHSDIKQAANKIPSVTICVTLTVLRIYALIHIAKSNCTTVMQIVNANGNAAAEIREL